MISEYQRTDSGWQIIRQYYWFPQPQDILDSGQASRQLKPRQACPGCGQGLTQTESRQHVCLGGRDHYPRLSNRHWPRAPRRRPRKNTDESVTRTFR